jgi:hypothetical protein
MSLADLAQVVLSVEGPALTQVGFGTLACACYHTHSTDLVLVCSSVADAATAGFLTYEPGYLMVARAFSQEPRPATVKLIRLATAWTLVVSFTPVSAVNSTIYSFTVTYKGVAYDVIYTSDSSATAAEIVTGLAAAFSALAAAISTHAAASGASGTKCVVTASAAGDMFYFSNWTDNLKFSNDTVDPGIVADLGVIRNQDSDWYGLAVDNQSKAIVVAADSWAETQDMLFAYDTEDSVAFDSAVTTDVNSVLKAASEGRVIGCFPNKDTASYMGVAALAERFPHDPGSEGAGGTFALKTLKGITPGAWNTTQIANLRAKNYMVYTMTAGRSHTLDGMVAGGEFADVIRGLDWYRIRSEERIATLNLNQPNKLPFTDRGISAVYSELRAQQLDAEAVELFVPGTSTLVAPKRANVNPTDRAKRKLSGFTGSVTLAGAIHLVAPIDIAVGT